VARGRKVRLDFGKVKLLLKIRQTVNTNKNGKEVKYERFQNKGIEGQRPVSGKLLLARSQVGSFAVNACGYPLAQKEPRLANLRRVVRRGKVAKIET